MPPKFQIDEEDNRLAEAINREARSDPSSPYAGKYVAIAGGKVVAAGERIEDVLAAMEKAVPDRHRGLVIEASADYEGPHEIWTFER
ncbi:MAG: DUF5678 domain-containing protein [Planctomycetales bacterium]